VYHHDLVLITHLTLYSIIAVQGFGSRYPHTWEMVCQSGANGERRTVMWLKDFLPTDLPKARILAFDYPSQWAGDPDYTSLKTCGLSLLNEIARDREKSNVRPQMCLDYLLIIG
jgi:hypothetical protein